MERLLVSCLAGFVLWAFPAHAAEEECISGLECTCSLTGVSCEASSDCPKVCHYPEVFHGEGQRKIGLCDSIGDCDQICVGGSEEGTPCPTQGEVGACDGWCDWSSEGGPMRFGSCSTNNECGFLCIGDIGSSEEGQPLPHMCAGAGEVGDCTNNQGVCVGAAVDCIDIGTCEGVFDCSSDWCLPTEEITKAPGLLGAGYWVLAVCLLLTAAVAMPIASRRAH